VVGAFSILYFPNGIVDMRKTVSHDKTPARSYPHNARDNQKDNKCIL
jgi:hypothetical protein